MASTSTSKKEVQVELFINGKGPRHVFKSPLRGWDENRLDLEGIMDTYKLKALYAFSLADGRGNRLLFNPRNGLSYIAYSGKPDALVRLDADPAEPLLYLLAKVLFGFVLIGFVVFIAVSDSLPMPLQRVKDSTRGHLAVVVCFLTMLYTQLVWRPLKSKRNMMHYFGYKQIHHKIDDICNGKAEETKKSE